MGNTVEHEFLIELFRGNLDLAAILLRRYLGVQVPHYRTAILASEDATDIEGLPKVKKADAVVIYLHEDVSAPPVWAVIVEVQRAKSKKKRFSWPVYYTVIRARHLCPTTLLVLCPDEATARWARQPIDMGQPGYPWAPLAATPGELLIDVGDAGAEAELVMLGVIGHPEVLHDPELVKAVMRTFEQLEEKQALTYADGVLHSLPQPAQQAWRNVMTAAGYRYQSDFATGYFNQGKAEGKAQGKAEGIAEGKAEGIVEGEARTVLLILRHRQVPVSEGVRQRILACTDSRQLEDWVGRALSVTDAGELFDET